MAGAKPFRLFVARPGDYSGASWDDAADIRNSFSEAIREGLAGELGSPVELVIEDEKTQPGSIYTSMFKEAWAADGYTADLTNCNPNVFLELGIRWALRDSVTVTVLQHGEQQPFNVASTRAIRYGGVGKQIPAAVKAVVKAIVAGKSSETPDSPVREVLQSVAVVVAANLWNKLNADLEQLQGRRAAEMLRAADALAVSSHEERIKMLKEVLVLDGRSLIAHCRVAAEFRNLRDYDAALVHAREAEGLAPEDPDVLQDLALTLRKRAERLPENEVAGGLEEAIHWYRMAVSLAPKNAEIYWRLGGAMRDLAFERSPVDWALVANARDQYAHAANGAENEPYGLLNVARLNLLLSSRDAALAQQARTEFNRAEPLCVHCVGVQRDKASAGRVADFYKWFDLADSLALGGAGKTREARKIFDEGLTVLWGRRDRSAPSTIRKPLQQMIQYASLLPDERATLNYMVGRLNEEAPASAQTLAAGA